MALLTDQLQELIPLFPESVHKKLGAIYRKIPGSLLKLVDPVHITKKLECREQNVQVNSSMHATSSIPRSIMKTKSSYNHRFPAENWFGQENSTNDDLTITSTSSDDDNLYDMDSEPNKYRYPLMICLLNSIKKNFDEQNITMISPTMIVEEIVSKCFVQSPDWGRYRCKQPSVIVRFNNRCIQEMTIQSLNINVYVYAFLKFHYKDSRLSFKNGQEPRISFEVTIELNGLVINQQKLVRTCDMLNSSNDLEDLVRKIEVVSNVTWEQLEKKHDERSAPPKPSLSWDDL